MISTYKVLSVLSLVFISAGFSTAASYYVTQSGSGSHTGMNNSNAWSVADYNASSTPTGGDTVIFSGALASRVAPATSGTGNGSGRLVLDFGNATMSASALSISGQNYLTFLGGPVSSSSSGQIIACSSKVAHDITISNFTFTGGAGGSTIFLALGKCNNVLVSNNNVDNVGSFINEGVGSTNNITVTNNYARTSVNVTNQTDLITLGDTINVVIEGNTLFHRAPGSQSNSRHNDIIQTYESGASTHQAPGNWVIRYNWIEANIGSGGDGSNSWTMLENVSGSPAMKIYGNVFVGSGSTFWTNGLDFNSAYSSAVVYLYNNTFFVHGAPGNTVRFQNSGILYARNNAGMASPTFSGTYLAWNWSAGAQWNRNFFYHFGDCSGTYSGPNGSCSADPLFVDSANNNFALQSSSPLLNVGDNAIGSEYNQGIAPGATWPNPTLVPRTTGTWDVGAYQHGSTDRPAPPTNVSAVAR